MSDNKKALAAIPSPVGGLAKPLASPDELIKYHQEIGSLITKSLEKGRDYGPIPGTKGDKCNLLKPGAERVCTAFGVSPEFEITEQEVDHDKPNKWQKYNKSGTSFGRYRYVLKCRLVGRSDGRLFGEGVGSCSSMESKYIENPRNVENTVLKMAKKRAFVDATLTAFSLSDRFTQDMEDKDSAGSGKTTNANSGVGAGTSNKSTVVYTATASQKDSLFDEALKFGAVRQDQEELTKISHHCMNKSISDMPGIVKKWYEDKKKGQK